MKHRHALPIATLAACTAFATPASAAPRIDLDPLDHDPGDVERVPARTLARFPAGTFLENIVALPDGALIVTEAADHELLRVDPDGRSTVLHTGAAHATGVALDVDGAVVATGNDAQERPAILVFSPGGELRTTIPVDGAAFLNGLAVLEPGVVLANDSAAGTIFRVDLATGEATTWLADEALAPDPERNELLPGANGIKLHDGDVWVSNSSRGTVLRVPLTGDELRAGTLEVVHRDVIIDDFAIAADGTIYGATHVFDSVVRLEPDGTRATIATAEDGVVGSTAVAFGRTATDATSLYVAGDGGVSLEPETAVEARVTVLDVGEPASGSRSR